MKQKKAYFTISTILFVLIFICSCKNFLNGSDAMADLKESIDYNNTPDVIISVSCNNAHGTITSGSGGTYKLGTKNIKLTFQENTEYQFIKWQVRDSQGKDVNCGKDDAIYIKNPDSSSTTFTIKKNVSDYTITAECLVRPAVSSVSPQYQTSGVNRDREIIIIFNDNIDKTNFRYTQEECATLEKKGCTLLKDSNNEVYGYISNGTVYYKNIKIRNANDTSENLLSFFGIPEIEGSKIIISSLSGAKNQLQLDSNGYKDIEVTLDNSITNNGTKMRQNYSWKYRISSVTDKQASVTFSADSLEGTLTPVGTAKYSIGSEVTVKFIEKSDYKFIKWNLVEGTAGVQTAAISAQTYDKETGIAEATVTILEGGENLTIAPVCVARSNPDTFKPDLVSAGVSFDSDIVITFKNPVSKGSFFYTEAECNNYGGSAVAVRDSEGNIIAVDLGSERIFKNISIKDENNISVEKHYNRIDLSEDRKTLTIGFDYNQLFDFSEETVKTINVSVSSEVYSDYTVGEETQKILMNDKNLSYDFTFKVCNTTNAKASITFDSKDSNNKSMGTLSYNGTQNFNVGQTLTVTFEPNENYEFIKWSVTGDPEGMLVVSGDVTKTTLTVNVCGEVSDVTIKPICEELKTSTILFSTESGTVSPNGYVDCKRKDTISLVCKPADDSSFTKWQVVHTITGKVYSDNEVAEFFRFDDKYSSTTNVQVLKTTANLNIIASTTVRPKVFAKTPDGISTQVDRDTNIRVFFTQKISEASLYYSKEELEEFGSDKTILCKSTSTVDGKIVYNKPYGYYTNKDDPSSYVFKNIHIIDKSAGTNYLQYFECPYISDIDSDSNGTILIIPVKKITNDDGSIDNDKNLPANREIYVTLDRTIGKYDNGVLVSIDDTNLEWMYKTNASFDTTFPKLKDQVVIKGESINGNKDFDNLRETSDESKTNVPDTFTADWYKNNFLKTTDGKAKIDLTISAKDDKSNLQSITLIAEKIQTIDYEPYSGSDKTKSYLLPITISGTDGDYSGTIDLRSKNTLNLDDGLYKLYFELQDDVGNKISTDKGEINKETNERCDSFYYIFIDSTPPRDNYIIRYKNKVSSIVLQLSNDLDFSLSDSTIIMNAEQQPALQNNSIELSGFTKNKNIDVVFHSEDIFGNSKDYNYTIYGGVKEGMYMYKEDDGYSFSDTFFSNLTPYGVVIQVENTTYKIATIPIYEASRNTVGALATNNPSGDDRLTGFEYYVPNLDEYSKIKQYNNKLVDIGATDIYALENREMKQRFDNASGYCEPTMTGIFFITTAKTSNDYNSGYLNYNGDAFNNILFALKISSTGGKSHDNRYNSDSDLWYYSLANNLDNPGMIYATWGNPQNKAYFTTGQYPDKDYYAKIIATFTDN